SDAPPSDAPPSDAPPSDAGAAPEAPDRAPGTDEATDTRPLADPFADPFAEAETRPLPGPGSDVVAGPDTRATADPGTDVFASSDTRPLAGPEADVFADHDTRAFADSAAPVFADDNTRPLPEARDDTPAEPGARTAQEAADAPGSSARDVWRGAAFGAPRGAAVPAAPPRHNAAHEPDALPDEETDAVDFFSTQRRARGFSTRGALLWAFVSLVLVVVLALQTGIAARDWLASRYPALRPAIGLALAPLGLAISAPRALEALTIEGFELQSTPVAGLYAMNALLRNGANHEVRWPAMELTLTGQGGAVVLRKVLMPSEYLPAEAGKSDPAPVSGAARARERGGARAPAGAIGPDAEIPLRVALEAAGVTPTGYTVKLFYP
ncbi:MAG: DUF3426 domain-containing protein, partial [Burkholderiaceae bacterium]|nr:DUF3426 domain-containing protein [Burkholderiaceae bacterium]